MQDEAFDVSCRFLNALAAAMQRYGVSSHTMEASLGTVARKLNLRSEFLATPTQVQSILWQDDEDRQRLHVSVSSAGDYDLTKLAQISELVATVEAGDVTPAAGIDRLREIERGDPPFGPRLDVAAFVLCGLGFAVILGLSWRDVLLAGGLSVASFGVTRLAARSEGLSSALELVVAVLASALATLLCLVFPGSNPLGVAVCAFIYFVPGFGLTLGASELMVGNTLSGLIGFVRAVVTSGKLFIGFLIGSALVRDQVTVPLPTLEAGVPHGWTWLFAPMLVVGLALLFRVRGRDLIWSLFGGIVVWSGIEAGASLGFWQGTFIGAFVLTVVSRIFSRWSGLPSAIILLPAVMLLVPGVSALRAFYVAETEGLAGGIRAAYEPFVLIAAILGGLLIAEAVWSLRRPRFPPLLAALTGSKTGDASDTGSGDGS